MTSVNFYDKEQTDDLLTAKADVSNVYTKSEIDAKEIGAPTDTASSTGSLWARLKNAVARIVSLETADSNNVKKTGTSTVTGDIQVPTTPATPTSVINSAYANDATEGVNNIAHKTGNETIGGIKSYTSYGEFKLSSGSRGVQLKTTNAEFFDSDAHANIRIYWCDKNDLPFGSIQMFQLSNNATALRVIVKNSDGSDKSVDLVRGDVI